MVGSVSCCSLTFGGRLSDVRWMIGRRSLDDCPTFVRQHILRLIKIRVDVVKFVSGCSSDCERCREDSGMRGNYGR